MTGKFLNFVLCCAVFMAAASIATATPVSCGGYTIVVGGQCTSDDLTYSFTNLSFSPSGSTDSLTISSANVSGSEDVLIFQISAPLPVDILLDYTVTGAPIFSIDASFGNAPNQSGSINETACGALFSADGTCSDPLSNISSTTSNVVLTGNPATFTPTSTVYISKDLNDQSTFSEFSDSVGVAPEPMSIALTGIGLLGIGVLGRRTRKR